MRHSQQTILNVARAPRVEISHRQREQLARDVIQYRPVEPDDYKTQKVALNDQRQHAEKQDARQCENDHFHQFAVVTDQHAVNDDLREDRPQHLHRACHKSQRHGFGHRTGERAEERPQPSKPDLAAARLFFFGFDLWFRSLFDVIEKDRVTAPQFFKLGAADSSKPLRRIGDMRPSPIRVVQDHPLIALRVDNRGQRHIRKMFGRGLNGARGQSQLFRAATQAAQARPG
ncbi:MAG: hypothetical protein JMDDDDMK_00052 [Acidobacteria bacterium]|nr:hypothetical protein [Acidobacteriota bacterium]